MSTNKAKNEVRFPAFRNAFLELKGSMTTTDFAKKLGMSRATVGFYEAGDRIPDALGIAKIARACNVSADWLLGLSKARDPQKTAVDELGLSNDAVKRLRDTYIYDTRQDSEFEIPRAKWISDLLCDPGFFGLEIYCSAIRKLVNTATEMIDNGNAENVGLTPEMVKANIELREKTNYPIRILPLKDMIELNLRSAESTSNEIIRRITGYDECLQHTASLGLDFNPFEDETYFQIY